MLQEEITFSRENTEFIDELRVAVKDYFKNNNLSKYGNWSIRLKSFLMLTIYLGPYFLMMFGVINSVLGIILSWIVMGLGMAGLGMVIMHDANHKSFSKNRGINEWLSKSIYIIGGFPPVWQYQHNTLHHGFTNIDGKDEDIESKALLRLSPHRPLWRIHKYQQWYAWFFYALMTIAWITFKEFKQLVKYKSTNVHLSSKKSYARLFLNLFIAKLIYYIIALVIPLIVLPVSWYWITLSFLLMHVVAGLLLSVIFQTAHVLPNSTFPIPDKSGQLNNNWAVHQLNTTSDYSPKSSIFSWFIGGLNYQVEHHLFPNISHVHYRELSKIVKALTEKYHLPYHVQKGFFQAIGNHMQMLKILGQ